VCEQECFDYDDEALTIEFFEGGSLVPAGEVFGAVESGTVQAGADWPGYWAGRDAAFSDSSANSCSKDFTRGQPTEPDQWARSAVRRRDCLVAAAQRAIVAGSPRSAPRSSRVAFTHWLKP
jgi:hypothetical protein